MHKIVYKIDSSEEDAELEWLYEQKIFPAVQKYYDWRLQKPMTLIGIIVGNEAALSVKLRHKLDTQLNYKQ